MCKGKRKPRSTGGGKEKKGKKTVQLPTLDSNGKEKGEKN